MCDPNLCPMVAAFDVADKVIDDLGDVHENPALARGVIASYRQTADAVRERYPCGGVSADREGHLRCPLSGIWDGAQTYATAAPNRQGWAFDPEKLAGGGRDGQSGQYL